jgi:hypothetical protein
LLLKNNGFLEADAVGRMLMIPNGLTDRPEELILHRPEKHLKFTSFGSPSVI